MVFVFVAVIAIALLIVLFVREPDPVKRAAVLRRTGFGLMALSAFVIAAFLVGETFDDPGGWAAAGLTAAWAVPLAGLAALAWLRPGWAVYVLAALTAGVIALSVWFALNPEGWRSAEDRHGPLRMVISFVLVTAIALLGLKRTAAAGVLLLTAGIIPVAVSSLGSFLGFTSLSMVSAPPVVTGVLYLAAAHLAGRRAPPAGIGAGPGHATAL